MNAKQIREEAEQAIKNATTVTWFKSPDSNPLPFYIKAYKQAKENGNQNLIAHYAKMIAEQVTKD